MGWEAAAGRVLAWGWSTASRWFQTKAKFRNAADLMACVQVRYRCSISECAPIYWLYFATPASSIGFVLYVPSKHLV